MACIDHAASSRGEGDQNESVDEKEEGNAGQKRISSLMVKTKMMVIFFDFLLLLTT